MSKAAEEDITNQLFSADIDTRAQDLTTEKNYVDFARQVSDVLYDGQAPYHIPVFFTELTKQLSKVQISSEDVKKISNGINVLFHNKLEEEKKARGGGKKKPTKPQLSQTKADNNLRNNNPAMINDLTGGYNDNDDYYDEEDYGGEADNSKRVAEPEYDFM